MIEHFEGISFLGIVIFLSSCIKLLQLKNQNRNSNSAVFLPIFAFAV